MSGTFSLKRLAAINRTISSTLDFEEVLRLIVDSARELVGAEASLVLLQEAGETMRIRAARGVDPEAAERFSGPLTESVLTDLARFLRFPEGSAWSAVPIVADRSLHGVVLVVRASPLSEEEIWLVSALADQAAIALRNAGLYRRMAEQERELRATVRELESFAYSIAHDLRAPLRAMAGWSHLLLEDAGPALDETSRDRTRRISDAASRMDALITDLLDFSRLGREALPLRDVELGMTVAAARERLRAEIERRNARVELRGPWRRVRAHAQWLERAVAELLSNALTFVAAGERPEILVDAADAEGQVLLRVSDNGIGIPEAYRERIFGVFERLHGMTDYPGTGIGLALVRRAVERMGGAVGLESEVGRGSRFWIRLPAARA